jgi:excisionase family DNA binding protein
MGMNNDELLQDGAIGIEEARKFTGLGRSVLYDLMSKGRLPFTKIGARRLIPRRALVEVLAQGLNERREGSEGR